MHLQLLKLTENSITYTILFWTETLRKYPPAVVLTREALNDYKIPDTHYIIEKGTLCFIPVYAIHHDADNYPNPEEFRPARFEREAVTKRDAVKWLPFGGGPRNCIGLRFAMMQIRLSLAKLLDNFEFSTTEIVPITFVPQNFMLTPEGGVYLQVKNLKRWNHVGAFRGDSTIFFSTKHSRCFHYGIDCNVIALRAMKDPSGYLFRPFDSVLPTEKSNKKISRSK